MKSLVCVLVFCIGVGFLIADVSAFGGLLDIFKSRTSHHEIIDSTGNDEPIGDIESVAKVLCQWSGTRADPNKTSERKQISRLTTIERLVRFFDHLDGNEDHKRLYGQCAHRYRQILTDLRSVLRARPDNVCSEDKLAAIERFHNDHLSTSPGLVSAQSISARSELHPMVGLFFMYYAMEVSGICKRSVLHSLEWDLDQFRFSQEEYQLGENNNLAHLLSGISDYLGPLDRIDGLDDVVYLWDLLDSGVVAKIIKSTLLVDENADGESPLIDPEMGAPIRLLIKVRNGHQAKLIQNKCLHRFRPIYSKVIMPVTRLSNLGYSSDLSSFRRDKSELINNELLQRWYSLVQICEAIRPIKFYEDPSLGPTDALIMTRGEADKLQEASSSSLEVPTEMEAIEYEPKTNSLIGVDRLYSVDKVESQELVRRVRLNVSAHDRSMGRIFGRLLRNSFDTMKSRLFQSVGKIFVLRKAAGADRESAAVRYDLKAEVRDSVGQLSDEEMRQLEASATAGDDDSHDNDRNKLTEQDVSASIGNGIILNIVNACAGLKGLAAN